MQLANSVFIKVPRTILLTDERFVFGMKNKNITFLTNAIDLSPLQIAEHYKKQVAD